MISERLDNLCINTIRCLCIDAVQKANSGHPGTPLGAAAEVYVLWDRYLKHNPRDPRWFNRDRFVLSAGHASMLLYSLLHLTGYDLSLEDIKNFRQKGSLTPGHPEYGLTAGVEVTSGPLGQGFANGVGMAIAERHLAARFNRPGLEIIDHYTYALVSDGDLEEGIASEAASLAGTLKLGKLIYLYDSNSVQQDGPTEYFKEDVVKRFEAYGWQVTGPIDGLDPEAVADSIEKARRQTEKPNLIICKTIIGYGSPHKAGTNAAHGEPLGEAEVRLTKAQLGWPYTEPFTVPEEALEHMRQAVGRGAQAQKDWQQLFDRYCEQYPREGFELVSSLSAELPADWQKGLDDLASSLTQPLSTRDAGGRALNILAQNLPQIIGGAADLAGSTRAQINNGGDFAAGQYTGRNLHYGLREHAMGAINNGLALHGGVIPFSATFLIFSDYMRPTIRLAALMKLRQIYIFTHDSIGVGEDGPTHQPVEQLLSLRAIPNLLVIRPADAGETVEAWKLALKNHSGPTALILTRQSLPQLTVRSTPAVTGVPAGGYIIWQADENPRLILLASGSEVSLALEAAQVLKTKTISARVVSLPCWSLFDAQTEEYREKVLPAGIRARISIEAAATLGWQKYIGAQGKSLGVDKFGFSAPAKQVFEVFGLTVDNIVQTALALPF